MQTGAGVLLLPSVAVDDVRAALLGRLRGHCKRAWLLLDS
jgi:hypothetical protein